MEAVIFIILLLALIIWGARHANKIQNSLTPETQAAMQAQRESEIFSGKYIGGHPDIMDSINGTYCHLYGNEITIYTSGYQGSTIGKIPFAEITNVTVENATTIEKRITATRLLLIGLFAFAAKKKEVHEQYYVTIMWGSGKIGNETIFEFEGSEAASEANKFRNIIAKKVNSNVPPILSIANE